MLVPKNLIFSSLKNNAAKNAFLTSKYSNFIGFLLILTSDRPINERFRYHLRVQREKE